MTEKETPLANVDANLFRAAHVCACREEVRLYINGVHIEKHPNEGAVLVATDGHRMIVVHDESAWCQKPITVSLPHDGLQACAPTRKSPAPRLVINENGSATIDGRWGPSLKPALVDGAFPDWRHCVPVRKWPNLPLTFNARYLVEFEKIAGMLGDKNHPSISVFTGDKKGDAGLILFPYAPHAFGLLMPMYTGTMPVGGLPRWMKPVMVVKAAAPVAKRKIRKAA